MVCAALRREVMEVVAAEAMEELEVVVFPCDCSRPPTGQGRFDKVLQVGAQRFEHLFLVGAPCLKARQPWLPQRVTAIEGCFDLFLPQVLIKGAAANTRCMALSATAFDVEIAGKAGRMEAMTSLMSELEYQFERLKTQIREDVLIKAPEQMHTIS